MGSEGRGEQILKTDQDNALLLRDDAPTDGLDRLAAHFSAAQLSRDSATNWLSSAGSERSA